MEIQETTVLRSLKKNLEYSIEKILSKHDNINDNTDISQEEFDTIVDTITKSKEISSITKKFFEYNELSENSKTNFMEHLDKPNLYNASKLENIFHQLQSKSVENKTFALESLMKYPVMDLVDKYKWPKVSKILLETLIHKNKDLFLTSLNIHIKLSTHPYGIIESTANLIKSLSLIFHSKRISTHITMIDFKNATQDQILKILNLTLNNFRIIFKNYNTNKDKLAENLIPQLLELLICHKDYERTNYIHVFYYVFVLDPNAKWFRQIMHNISTRKIVINYCIKNNAFFKYVIKEIISYIESDVGYKTSFTTEISLDIIKFAAYHHCCNILIVLLSCKWGHKLFPVEVKSCETNLSTFIMLIITSVQNLTKNSRLIYKSEILVHTLKTILLKNQHFLYNKDIVHALIKPFLFKIHERQKLTDIARKNIHVLEIINAVCNTPDAFFLIFGFTEAHLKNNKRQYQYIKSISLQEPLVMSVFIDKYTKQYSYPVMERENISIGKVIVDFTSNFVRYHTTSYDTMAEVDDMVYKLLECCCNIHQLHTHVMLLVDTKRLLQASLNFYKILIDHDLIQNSMNSLLKFFVIVCETRFGTDLFLKEDTESLYVLCKHYFFIFDNTLNNQRHFTMFFINAASTVPGCIAITECRKQLISPFLNKIWKIDEDQLLFLSGSGNLLEEETFKYYKFIFGLHLNFICVQSLLSQDSDDDSTIIDTDEKPTNLKDLIDETMNSSGPGIISCFVGLQTIRILMNNMDVLIFLEHAADLKDQISILQLECASVQDTKKTVADCSSFIIDECSSLRRNITEYIQNVGIVKSAKPKSKSQQLLQSTKISARNSHLHEFQKFLNESRNSLHDNNWTRQVRKLFRQTFTFNFRENTFADLIQQVRSSYQINNNNCFSWPDNNHKLNDLFAEDVIGINIIVRFGKYNKLLLLPIQHEEILSLLLKQVNSFLNINRDKFEGFDWFVGVIFLMCSGNLERSKTVLQIMAQLPAGPYIWPAFGQQFGLTQNFDFSIHFDHTLNRIIGDLEIFKPALEDAGISWNFIVKNWFSQCFFNVLPWFEISNFLVLSILFPVDYVLYFIVTCAQHLERKFLDAITSTHIHLYHNITQLAGYQLSDYFNSLDQLARQYKHILSKY